MWKTKRKHTKFKAGQFIVILTGNKKSDEAGFLPGYVYRQERLYDCISGYNSVKFDRYCEIFKRGDKFNWRFANNQEIAKYLKNKGPVLINNDNIDNYSII